MAHLETVAVQVHVGLDDVRTQPCRLLEHCQVVAGAVRDREHQLATESGCATSCDALASGVGDVLIVDGRERAPIESAAVDPAPARATRLVPTPAPAGRP